MMQKVFSLLAISQGALVLGLTLFIMTYYLPKTRKHFRERVRWHIVSVSLSYILLTIATVKTAAFEYYNWGDGWYWIVTVAYIVGDVSIIVVFREAVKESKKEQLKK